MGRRPKPFTKGVLKTVAHQGSSYRDPYITVARPSSVGRPPRDLLLHRLIRCGETAAFKYRPRAAQVRCLEALREPIVYRRENLPRIIMPILPHPYPR